MRIKQDKPIKMKNYNLIKLLFLLIVAVLTIGLFVSAPAPIDRLLNIQNYLITASGIISGILIAYLSSKLFNIKQDRIVRQTEIDKYSNMLTNYRKILYAVLRSHQFWVKYADIPKFKKKYPDLNFEKLHGSDSDESMAKFWLGEEDLSITTIDLYLAMEEIFGEKDEHEMPWIYDKNIEFNYSLDTLNRYRTPSNQIWYYLEGKYAKHTEGLINDNEIWVLFRPQIKDWVSEIDNKFRGRSIDRHLLAEISTDFYEIYIPKLIELTKRNIEGLPKNMKMLFLNLILIFIIGVIFPLFIQSLNLIDCWNIILTLSGVGIVILSFVNFIFDFYKIMLEEIKPK